MRNSILLWILTVLLTLSSVVYQRLTGPSHPKSGSIQILEEEVNFRLPRSHETVEDAPIRIEVPEGVKGKFVWRRYKSHDDWMTEDMKREAGALVMGIPKQPSAGKVMYRIILSDHKGGEYNLTEEPIIIRFRDPVPLYILIPHVILMFSGMLISTRAGLEAVANRKHIHRYAMLSLIVLFVGGLIFGPLVQKFAFGAFWTGWPFGTDLTDNKTVVAVIFWALAVFRARKPSKGRGWIITASVVTLVIFIIPHSLLGSELDYTELESTTGK